MSKVEIDLVDFPILDHLSIDFNLFLTLDGIAPVLANAAKLEVFLNIPSNLRPRRYFYFRAKQPGKDSVSQYLFDLINEDKKLAK